MVHILQILCSDWSISDLECSTLNFNKYISPSFNIIVERPPQEYSTKIMIEDETGDYGELAGAYIRQNSSLVWKYDDYELAFNGNLWCITGGNVLCKLVTGWEFSSAEMAWPYTDTLYIIGW